MSDTHPPTTELQLLQEKRGALEQVVKIAEAVERLHHGLTAVLLLGKPTHLISNHAIESFEALDEKTHILPSIQLHQILEQLEKNVQEKLASILQIAKLDDQDLLTVSEGPDATTEAPEILLKEYQKLAQTAVALRVLLHARGERTKATHFSMPADYIRQKICDIAKRENLCRNRVRKQVMRLIQDTGKLLKRKDLPNGMQEMLQTSREGLMANLLHIKAGGNLQNMPVAIEVIEIADTGESMRKKVISINDKKPTEEKKPSELEIPLIEKKAGLFSKAIDWIKSKFTQH